jgi:hypothetical protein
MIKHVKISYMMVVAISLLAIACETNEEDLIQGYKTGAVYPEITEIQSPFFDILDVDNAYINFTADADREMTESISIEKTFRGVKTEFGTYTSLPVEINVTAAEAVADIDGISVGDIELGDVFLFEVLVTSKSGFKTRSNVVLRAAVACKSDLTASYTFSTVVTAVGDGGDIGGCDNPVTGTGTFTETGPGLYSISDASFGQYDCAWGDTPAVGVTFSDVCNTLTAGGSDQWGLVYTFFIKSIDGPNLELEWSNDYNDKGVSILTRTDGKDWPEGLKFE